MTRASKVVLGLAVVAVAGGAVALVSFLRHGISARDEPTAAEAFVARRLRHLAVPRQAREARNPVAPTPEALARARAHFADHCASCHGNDGKGQTPIGRNLYPKAPDMSLPETQSLSDGELFYIIENGVRLTGMPAWGSPGPENDAETWELVHFIRHLPKITADELAEMEELNPKTRKEIEEEEATRRFLAGEAPAPEAGGHEH
jgi:mono/diheme cytochrome c family protein